MKNVYLKHYYDEPSSGINGRQEADKSLTIANASDEQLRTLLSRLYLEKDVEEAILQLRRNAAKGYSSEKEVINTNTPINQLYHHGIKGQRWGVRRYQNEDGSLTDKGKKKYTVNEDGSFEKKKVFTGKKVAAGVLTVVGGLAIGKAINNRMPFTLSIGKVAAQKTLALGAGFTVSHLLVKKITTSKDQGE